MQYITAAKRTQTVLFPQSLDEIISADNEVRIIDLFVERIDLSIFKFVIKTSFGRSPALSSQRSAQAVRVWLH